MTLKTAIIGASGYVAAELFRILANHPEVEITGAHDIRNLDTPVSRIHPNLRGIVDLVITEPDYREIGKEIDAVFVATPHGIAMKFVPEILKGKAKIIDLSADYRFEDIAVYEKYYVKHESPEVKGVYGLPELHREKIKRARLVAVPGCYPTAAILGLAPLVKRRLVDLEHLVIDAKSGTSGAGATPTEPTHHPLIGGSMRAYLATKHRHEPEINQELSRLAGQKIKVHFTPHLVPIVRGILSTTHVFLKERVKEHVLLDLYREFYGEEPFVRVLDELPQVNFVVGSNYCDIGLELAAEGDRLVVVTAIDNLIKGASGQAVQDMNLMFGFEETRGLEALALRP
jgi:N-acetyl-gamma-glutamyl-phosphate reductase